MINYRKGKACYQVNDLGCLYIDESKVVDYEQPIIYIGGQMEHRCHVIEKSGYTGDLNHNMYTGSWLYDYSVFSNSKDSINAQNFSENLLESLKEAKLNEVILLTHSHGGLIGAYASKSDLIDKVISVHPPILGTPLANPEFLQKYKKLLTKTQQLILSLASLLVNSQYGFQQDNFIGVDLRKVDLNKLLVVGNYLNPNDESNKVMLETYRIIEKVINFRSDGVVPFEPSIFESQGINYLQMEEYMNHMDSMDPKYFESILSRVLTK